LWVLGVSPDLNLITSSAGFRRAGTAMQGQFCTFYRKLPFYFDTAAARLAAPDRANSFPEKALGCGRGHPHALLARKLARPLLDHSLDA
jgi:hypothetical protein